ncbi:MAG: C40 family peptidase [Lachnospiraceae bacterium]|nr:C40 family peptidase [Lachnospiraceae bacterium]
MKKLNRLYKKRIGRVCAGAFAGLVFGLGIIAGTSRARAAEETTETAEVEVINWDSITMETPKSSAELPMAGAAPMLTGDVPKEETFESMFPQAGAALALTGEVPEAAMQEESEYASFAIANVTDYVNVRMEPNTSSDIVGKMYAGSVAQIQEVVEADGEWFKVLSGDLEGYIKSDYFIYGEEAALVMEDYVRTYAYIDVDQLNVRKSASTDAAKIGYFTYGEKAEILADEGEWLKVRYAKNKEGYIYKKYCSLQESFIYAKTTAQEEAEMEIAKQFEQRTTEVATTPGGSTPEPTRITELPTGTYATNVELRSAIVNYALQFVGCPYVMGGNSLTNGTDCSGFTSLIFKQFGINLSRVPSGQMASAGRPVSLAEAQPGDIVCYNSGGGRCGHVAIYIGNGQIVHAATRAKGICVANVGMMPILTIKNVID